MAAVLPLSNSEIEPVTRPGFRTFPRPAMKKQGLQAEPVMRYDRHGTLINGKEQRITFVDRVLNQPLHKVVLVDTLDYTEASKTLTCKCNLL